MYAVVILTMQHLQNPHASLQRRWRDKYLTVNSVQIAINDHDSVHTHRLPKCMATSSVNDLQVLRPATLPIEGKVLV